MKNKARVEGSICEAYLVEETSTFASYYYPPDSNVEEEDDESWPSISIFNYPGSSSGKSKTGYMEQRDLDAAHLYVLQNCEEVEPYLE